MSYANKPFLDYYDKYDYFSSVGKRMYLEQKKVQEQFPQFKLSHKKGTDTFIFRGYLQTNAKNVYKVRIVMDESYPNVSPDVYIDNKNFYGVPHIYVGDKLCLFHPRNWNPGYHTIAFVIARTAKWLNKYEVWKRTSEWPGSSVSHEQDD